VVGHAVEERTSLHFPTPQNGNFLRVRRRLSAKNSNFGLIPEAPETGQRAKSIALARFFDASTGQNRETRLGDWGSVIRTAKFLFQNWPLKLRGNFGYSGGIAGQRLSGDKVARIPKNTPPGREFKIGASELNAHAKAARSEGATAPTDWMGPTHCLIEPGLSPVNPRIWEYP
jgi:hypothetical protein